MPRSGASYGFVPRFVAAIAGAMPDLELTLLEMGTADQIAALGTGQLDLVVIRPLESRGNLTLTCVAREPLRLAMPRSHRLAKLNVQIRADDLEPENSSPAENLYFHALIATAMHAAALTPVHVQHVRSIHAMLPLVGAGIGLAIVPDVSSYLRFDGVCLKPLEPAFTATADLYMAWRDDRLGHAARRIATEILPRSC